LNLVCDAGGVFVTGLRGSSAWYGFGSVARYGFELLGKCMTVPWDPPMLPTSNPRMRLAFERDVDALVVDTALVRGCTKIGTGGSASESESDPSPPPFASERAYRASKKSVEAGGGADLREATVDANDGAWSVSGAITWDRRTFKGGVWLVAGGVDPLGGGVSGATSLMRVLLRFGGIIMLFRWLEDPTGGDSDRARSGSVVSSPPNADIA